MKGWRWRLAEFSRSLAQVWSLGVAFVVLYDPVKILFTVPTWSRAWNDLAPMLDALTLPRLLLIAVAFAPALFFLWLSDVLRQKTGK